MAATIVLASEARTTSGQSGHVDIGGPSKLAVGLNVTAASGTAPTLDVKVQWTHDDGVTWLEGEAPDAFTQATGVEAVVRIFDVKASRFRIVYTIGGTVPSFTFSVTAHSF